MPAILNVPSQLRPFVDGNRALELSDGTLDGALNHLDGQFPGLRDRLIDEFGEVRPFINIFINGDDIIYLQGLLTPIVRRHRNRHRAVHSRRPVTPLLANEKPRQLEDN